MLIEEGEGNSSFDSKIACDVRVLKELLDIVLQSPYMYVWNPAQETVLPDNGHGTDQEMFAGLLAFFST